MNATAIKDARRRLRGAWSSDKARTVQNWVFPKSVAAARLKTFREIFGKNTWRFARSVCYFEFDGLRSRAKYDILWADQWSVVVVFHLPDGERCYQLFFEEEYFYLAAGKAGNAEYFRRVDA
ncbi:MAG TPA: hypothetical protein VGM81_20235 [Burkholderiaceae bacterium]|jgi:hypothetical protein